MLLQLNGARQPSSRSFQNPLLLSFSTLIRLVKTQVSRHLSGFVPVTSMEQLRRIVQALVAALLFGPLTTLVEAQGWSPHGYFKSPWGVTTQNQSNANGQIAAGVWERDDWRYENCVRAPVPNSDGSEVAGSQPPLDIYTGTLKFYQGSTNRGDCFTRCFNMTRAAGVFPRYYSWTYAAIGWVPPDYSYLRCFCGNVSRTPIR